jgi:hypothetical protein
LKTLKSKQLWQILAIIAIIVASVILLFVPQAIDNKYPYTYQNIQDKNDDVNSLNQALLSNEGTIQTFIQRLEEIEKEDEVIKEEAFKIRKGIKETDFELHIPSVLIALEQNAIKNNVEIVIGYNSMQETADDGGTSQPAPSNENEVSEGVTITEEETTRETETGKEQEGADKSEQENKPAPTPMPTPSSSIPEIPGINVNTIPIQISGSYSNVRNYIRYLDEVGMIEPSSVVLMSEGRKVSGSVMLNIFHGEVD